MKVQVLSADRYVIAANLGTTNRKVFQVICSKKDGSIYVAFPYYERARGVLGEVALDPSLTFPTDLTIGETFYGTSHVVKYAHHTSGRAHFSLTGKVDNKVKKASVPLSSASGHIFTVMVQGISQFKRLEPSPRNSAKRAVVLFPSLGGSSPALKFIAHWYSEEELKRRVVSSDGTSPWFTSEDSAGNLRVSITLATAFTSNNERGFLLLACESVPSIAPKKEVALHFLGGFDPPRVVHDHEVRTSFLAYMYPEPEGADGGIAGALGSIDL